MPEIRYMCLSDLHLGEEDALLTDFVSAKEPPVASQVLRELAKCLRLTLKDCCPNLLELPENRPTLVLNGDILEFALCPTNQAVMAFRQFVAHIMPGDEPQLFGKIILNPGNHDHHIWETARETQYVNYLSSFRSKPPKEFLEEPWHTTNIFVEVEDEGVPTYFLQNVIRRFAHLTEMEVRTAYPNFGILHDGLNKCVVFHHGHYIESLYHLMSSLIRAIIPTDPKSLPSRPSAIWDIEEENGPWVDFFWSTMGSSGVVGEDIERIYESFQKPDVVAGFIVNFIKSTLPNHTLPKPFWIIDFEKPLKDLISLIAERIIDRERKNDQNLLSPDALSGLKDFLDSLIAQITNEIKERPEVALKPGYDLTLVLGHTHKPFSWNTGSVSTKLGVQVPQQIYNTGGWIVETTEPATNHGAAVVLVDENLSTACIRLYNETRDGTEFAVRVETADPPSANSLAFLKAVHASVNNRRAQWEAFAQSVAATVDLRRKALIARVTQESLKEAQALQ